MVFGLFGILTFLIALPLLILHLWALVDELRTPPTVWTTTNRNQLAWAIVVLFLSVIGPILCRTMARPQLIAALGVRPCSARHSSDPSD